MDIDDKAILQCMNTERVDKINFSRCYNDGTVHSVGVEFKIADCSVYGTF